MVGLLIIKFNENIWNNVKEIGWDAIVMNVGVEMCWDCFFVYLKVDMQVNNQKIYVNFVKIIVICNNLEQGCFLNKG